MVSHSIHVQCQVSLVFKTAKKSLILLLFKFVSLSKICYFVFLQFSKIKIFKKNENNFIVIKLHTVNTKRYDAVTGTAETVPVVSLSLTVKRYL